jgi:hypothetical protein
MFKGSIVTRGDCAGPDCAKSDSVGAHWAELDSTCTLRVGFCAVAHRAVNSSHAIFCQQNHGYQGHHKCSNKSFNMDNLYIYAMLA